MKYILTLTLLLLTLLPTGAVKKVDANPINVAVVIAEQGDSAKIASLFEYYGYEPQGIENEYQVMKHPNGNEMCYSFSDSGLQCQYPTIVVNTKATPKEIDAILTELKFVKVGNAYERMISRYNNYITRCSSGPHNTLIIERIHQKQ